MTTGTLGKFNEYHIPVPWSGCWIWIGPTTVTARNGIADPRPILESCGKRFYAYRFSFLHFVGTIPFGKCVCHKCDQPLCVNPHHLFLGSRKENIQDCIAKGRHITQRNDFGAIRAKAAVSKRTNHAKAIGGAK